MDDLLEPNGQPDWELIYAQLWLNGIKDDMAESEIGRAVNVALRKMKQEWRETGQIKGWIEPRSAQPDHAPTKRK